MAPPPATTLTTPASAHRHLVLLRASTIAAVSACRSAASSFSALRQLQMGL